MLNFLKETAIIDYSNQEIQRVAKNLSANCETDTQIAKNCFLYVRDNINHTGDHKDNITTSKASDVLRYKTGWCYAKSHLLASLLRANSIPTGFCYQRLSCSEYKKNIYCLHGLNAIYLKDYGWYRVDARGNKKDVNAQFNPPLEKLAFKLKKDEYALEGIYEEPLDIVIKTLEKNKTYDDMINNFPDIKPIFETEFCKIEYMQKYNGIFCKWKKFSKFDDYRKPLEFGLHLIKLTNATTWITDTTNGFQSTLQDTQWLLENFIPKTINSTCKTIIFIIKNDSPIKNEINKQTEALSHHFTVKQVQNLNEVYCKI